MTRDENLTFKGVLIDFGHTLAYIDEMGNKKYHEALLSTTRKFGYRGALKELTRALDDFIWNSMKGEFTGMEDFWVQFAKNLDITIKPNLVDCLEKVRSRYSSVVFQLYDGALSALAYLQRKYQLALVSNCAIGTSDVIKALGLPDFFECTILSYEVGVRKPHRQMYLEALRCLGVKPDECIFVADEISDLEGAKEIGMKTILVLQGLNTFHDAKDPDFQPDFKCNSITEITTFL
ncbi:MAG: HAD family hydrolase [Candidatus Bathyarchaeia archaeon]